MMKVVMVIMTTTTMVLISGRDNVKNSMRDSTRVKFTRENWTSCKRRNTGGANTWSSEVLGSWGRPREAAGCDTWDWRPSGIALLPGGTGRSFLCWWARSTRPWYSGLGLPSPGGESLDRAAGKSRLGGMYIDEYIWRISTKDKHVHTYKTIDTWTDNNYSPKWRWIAVDKGLGKYPPLFTDTEANNCISIYNTSLIAIPKYSIYSLMKMGFARHFFSPEAARRWLALDFRDSGTNQIARNALFTCVVYTKLW